MNILNLVLVFVSKINIIQFHAFIVIKNRLGASCR
jgi:hypothetical protein